MATTDEPSIENQHSEKLSILNPTPIRCHGPELLHQLVRSASALPALEFLDNGNRLIWSYKELHEQAEVLAGRITRLRYRRGLSGPPFVVPVLIPQSPDLYISLLAILKAGGAFCPLNIDAPSERIKFICQDVNAKVCLVSRELAKNIPKSVEMDIILAEQKDEEPDDVLVHHRVACPEDLAYVMYTSGSTGTPKGVALSHDAVTQSLLAHDRYIPSFSRFLQFAAPTFDVSVFEIFFPLFRGSTLICTRREDILNDLPALLRTMEVDACELTPTVAGSLLRKREHAPGLRLLLTIGEMLNEPVTREFGRTEEEDGILWAMYGPTEATIHCTIQPAFDSSDSVNTIGVPLDTVSCFIITPASSASSASDFTILPRGEIGELAVGGFQLATEYINRPEQTASAFISSPFGRIYRTGDKARFREDGTIECLGRLSDGQIKLRGQRIELGEVESVVLRTPGCYSSVALVIESTLVVFCAVESGTSEQDVFNGCKTWLPHFMIPGAVVTISGLPRLPSGKVDRKVLRDNYVRERITDTTALVANGDEISRITTIVLGIGLEDDTRLSAAGLDSLRAIQLASLLREAGFDASASQLLATRDLSELRSRLRPLSNDHEETIDLSLMRSLNEITQQNPALQSLTSLVEDLLPCTPIQEAMLAETAREPSLYNNEVELETGPGWTIEGLSSAFKSLIQRNEILRTGFVTWTGGFVSVIFAHVVEGQVCALTDRPWRMEGPLESPHPPFQVRISQQSEAVLRLHIKVHHACYDGWSMDMMLSDISDMLQQLNLAKRPQFRDILRFYHQEDASTIAASKAFWGAHLDGWAKSNFPTLTSRQVRSIATTTVRKSCQIFPEKVQDFSQRYDCAPQVIFQAASSIVWAGLLGTSDIVMGTVTSGRSLPITGIENLIGPCITTIPLRCKVDSDTQLPDLLRSIHSHNRNALRYSTINPSELKKVAALQASDTLFDLVFVFQKSLDRRNRKSTDKVIREIRHADHLEAKILIEVENRNDEYALQLTCRSDIVPEIMIKILMDQLDSVVQSILEATDDHMPLSQISMASQLSMWKCRLQTDHGILDVAKSFEVIAAGNPSDDAVCLMSSSSSGRSTLTTISYQTLNEQSNRMARLLLSSGVAAGHVVAMAMEKSIDLYVSILAIVKAGCGYLPLLPSTPAARAEEIIRQGNIRHCVIGEGFSGFGTIDGLHYVDMAANSLENIDGSNIDMASDLASLAYVIYTSGTTGAPKGVAVTHMNLASNLASLEKTYPRALGRQGRMLQMCSQAFDVSVFEIFFTWTTGMCLCTGTNDVLFEDLARSVQRLAVTHLSLTPTVAALINPLNVPGVEFLVTAGEAMTQSVSNSWGDRLWQGYGPSETTNICSVKQMGSGDLINHLGWVLPNTSVFVMAPDRLEVLPIGWVGEFCFGGDQVAAGYFNTPELTARSFIDHPTYGRLYRSGDLGRMLDDGSLLILGRLDTQIKLRGQRIEAGEINSLVTATGITVAVTLLLSPEGMTEDQLATFFSTKDGQVDSDTHHSLFATLRSRLPEYMVPSYLIPVKHIPLTSSGKTDDRHLREFFKTLSRNALVQMSDQSQHHDSSAAWTSRELAIRAVISQDTSIPLSTIGRWTPFAALGIDSVSAIRFAKDLGLQLHMRVAISQILQNPSIAQLAKVLDEPSICEPTVSRTQKALPEDVLAGVRSFLGKTSNDGASIFPCTPLQEAMLSRTEGSYYNKILLRLRVDADLMKGYWQTMTRRHGILRTLFATTSNADYPIVQVTLSEWEIQWKAFQGDEPALDGATRDHVRCLPEPLDSGVPPVSFAIIRHGDTNFLSLICHHALYDGVAMELLWREVEALSKGRALVPSIPYEPFVWETLELPQETPSFWSDQFGGFRPSFLFREATTSFSDPAMFSKSLSVPLDNLHSKVQSLNVSMLALFQAAWASTLAVVGKVDDVCFGNVVSGRTLGLDGLDRLVAPCFNTIPIRHNMSKSTQNIELMQNFHHLNSEILHYQFTPLRRIQKIVNPHGRGLFDTLLIMQPPLQDMDDKVWTLEEDAGDMDIPLVCEVVPCPSLNSVFIKLHYDKGIIPGAIADAMMSLINYIVENLVESPLAPPLSHEQLPSRLRDEICHLAAREDKVALPDGPTVEKERWSTIEEDVRQVLFQLSGAVESSIRRNTTIFRLGLDSINAVQVASLLRNREYHVTASDVMELTTCAGIASRIAEKLGNGVEDLQFYSLDGFAEAVADQVQLDEGVEAILPCTPMQNAMMASFLQSESYNYLNVVSYRIEAVTLQALFEAWSTVQRLHPMLRTVFASVKHRDSAFAMVRRSADFCDLPISQHHGFVDVESQYQTLAKKLQTGAELPWKVVLAKSRGDAMMHVIIHHVLYDAQSFDALLGALASVLTKSPMVELPSIERGLAVMMHSSVSNLEASEGFWREQAPQVVVNSFPVMTSLKESRRLVSTHDTISKLRLRDLLRKTREHDYSVQALVQAAWTRVLSSYLGEESVTFGVTLSQRTADSLIDLPMPCLTTVPVIATNTKSNRELVEQMMCFNSSLHRYQATPLSQIQKWLGHPASSVFDTLLVYQRLESHKEGHRLWQLVEDRTAIDYPVSLEVLPREDGAVHLRMTYFTDIIPKQQAAIMVRQFDAVLAHIVESPDGNEDDLSQSDDLGLFSVEPAATPELPAPVGLLHEFIELRAKTHPHDPALECVSGFDGEVPLRRTWTYEQLNAFGNAVAVTLADQTKVGDIIAIHFDKCPEAYFSILGILKAGCSFVALDPTAPQARKEYILEDSRSACLLVKDPVDLGFADSTKVINITETTLLAREREWKGRAFGPETACYCLYTSGTTGNPKGCEISHENAVQAMMAFQELFKDHWKKDSRWLQFAALHFDVSVLEQYWSWSVGITVVAAPKDVILDDLVRFIRELDITHIDLTPSLARLTHPDEVPSLCRGVFITGGEQLKQEILDVWGPKAVIYNAYGPTEATIGVTMYQRVPVNGRPTNIGKQFPNVGTYVLRPNSEMPVFRGGIGELCVDGRLVGKGYLHRPELTNEKFPRLRDSGVRIYRTGDLVRILHNGCFDFLGRADDQIKLRGQRLEIGEINHVIRTGASQVSDVATVVAQHSSSGKDVLVSFLVSKDTLDTTTRVLLDDQGLRARAKSACQGRLPGYMVPTYFIQLTKIPLSTNNKAEVKQLQALFASLSHEQLSQLASVASRGMQAEKSAKLVKTLAEFSGVPATDISGLSSIFDLGVDSISALPLVALIKERLGLVVPSSFLLRHPIIQDLAEALAESRPEKTTSNQAIKQVIRACQHRYQALVCRELAISLVDIEYIAPCSPLQEGILSRIFTQDDKDLYFNDFDFDLSPEMSFTRLRAAWQSLVESQSILRTMFVSTSNGFVQAALKSVPISWESHKIQGDLQGFVQFKKAAWTQKNAVHITHPYEVLVVEGPSFRRLVIFIFHASYDGISFDLMMQSLASTYTGAQARPGPEFLNALSHGPLQRFDSTRKFWEIHFQGWRSSALAPLQDTRRTVMTARTISSSKLETIRQSHNTTLQTVIMALWVGTLQNEMSVGTTGLVVSGRSIDLPDVDQVIGPLFNTLPFFHREVGRSSWSTLIKRCHDFVTTTRSFQHAPLQDVQKWCSRGKALFDNLFTFQVEQPESSMWKLQETPPKLQYNMAFEATKSVDGHIRLLLVAKDSVADESLLESLLDAFSDAVDVASQAPETVLHSSISCEGDSRQDVLSVQADTTTSASGFIWTERATTMRSEIARLLRTSPDEIAPDTSIFELGLDSIDVIKLSARLKAHNLKIPASQIMRSRTIREIARLDLILDGDIQDQKPHQDGLALQARLASNARGRIAGLDAIEAILPPTPLQESMVAGMLQSDCEWYFNHDIQEVSRDVDVKRLEEAWTLLIQKSPVLRTGFLEVEDPSLDCGYSQIVFRQWQSTITHHHLASVAELQDLLRDAKVSARQGNGLSSLLQIRFATVESQQFVLVSIAHALYDGWSLSLMYEDLRNAYDGTLSERPSAQSYLATLLTSAQHTEARAFWSDYLADVRPTLLSNPASSSPKTTATETQTLETISSYPASRVLEFCKYTGISLQVLCQACLAVVLAYRARSLDVAFGLVLAGRDFAEADEIMFPTMNTVALRCILHGTKMEFVRYLEDNMSDIRLHHTYPLRKVQSVLKAQGPLFDVLFTLQTTRQDSPSSTLFQSKGGSAMVEYPICVEAEHIGEQFIWRATCQWTDGYNASKDVTSELEHVLGAFVLPEDGDLLVYHGQTISLCQLPNITLAEEGMDTGTNASGENVSWTPTSRSIAEVLSMVSGVPIDSIAATVSLYDLGLDSISAIKVSSLLRKEGIDVRPRELLTATNIPQMAEFSLSNSTSAEVPEIEQDPWTWLSSSDYDLDEILRYAQISHDDIEMVLPATAMQVYMMSAWQSSEGAVFFPEFHFRVSSKFTIDRVHEAWRHLVCQAPILRTNIITTPHDDLPMLQVVVKESTSLPNALVTLAVENDNNSLVVRLKLHHALYDGVSLPRLTNRLLSLIEDASQEPNNGPSGWAEHAIRPALAPSRAARQRFWTRYLGSHVAADAARLDLTARRNARVSHLVRSALPASQTSRLREHAAREKVGIQPIFLAAYAMVLARQTGATDVVFGIYLASREGADALALYPTLELLPLRVKLTPSRNIYGLARTIQKDIHEISTAGAHTGLWEISRWTGVRVDSFVNFLGVADEAGAGLVGLLPEDSARPREPVGSPWVAGRENPVADAYPLSVDVEASVNDGAMDIGVFASRQRISEAHAMALTDLIVEYLREAVR